MLAVIFSLGYWAGSNSQKTLDEISPVSTDIGLAFGSVKSPDPVLVHETTPQLPSAMDLSGLVAGLEKKVAANPENIDQQLLLAQTYNELGNREKSLRLLNTLLKQLPKNPQVKITLATILMKSMDRQELQHASRLFEDAIKLNPDSAIMARPYMGQINTKLDSMVK